MLLSGGLDSYTAAAIAKAQRLRAVRADHRLRSAPRARGRGGARGRARARRRAAPRARRSTCAPSADRRSPRTPPVPRDRDLAAADIPSTYVPARNTIFLSLALGWAEVARRPRHRHRRQRARLFRLSRLPSGVHRRVRAAGRPGDARRRRGRAVPRAHAAASRSARRDIIRRGLELGLDYGLTHSCYDPSAGRTALRRVRQLRAARQRASARRASPTRSSWARIARLRAHPQRPAHSAPGRRDHVRAAGAVCRWPRPGPRT